MNKRQLLLGLLADGKFHSGTVLADTLGVSRMAIWKQVQALRGYGLEIYSVKRRGYRLAYPLELLNSNLVKAHIGDAALAGISELELLFETGSTNRYLMDKLPREDIHGDIVAAEFQSAGKGSKDERTWISPLGGGIYLSIGWHFNSYPNSFTALSLSAGVAVARALRKCGIEELALKWPNDIVSGGRKLGGILIESRGITKGHCDIVIGIGLNVRLPDQVQALIGQPYTDLSRLVTDIPSRNKLVGMIIGEAITMLGEFKDHGFARFIEEWRSLDHFSGKDARLIFSGKTLTGRVLGIEDNGMLSMSINGRKKLFASGELSLRGIS